MKIYTRGGDKGQTSLLGGQRVSKTHMRIHAYGTVDELNSYIGLLCDQEINKKRLEFLREVQNALFTIGAHLAAGTDRDKLKLPALDSGLIKVLESAIDDMEESLPPLKSFLLPGGHQSVSVCHITRCVCRRAERMVVALEEGGEVMSTIVKYLNRLSDYLFVLSRTMAKDLGVGEIPWKAKR